MQTEHVYHANFQESWIGGTVGRVTTTTAFGFYRNMLVSEGTLLVDMAPVANGIPAGQCPQLAHDRCPMRVMAIIALDETFVDPVVIGFGEISFSRSVASVT